MLGIAKHYLDITKELQIITKQLPRMPSLLLIRLSVLCLLVYLLRVSTSAS